MWSQPQLRKLLKIARLPRSAEYIYMYLVLQQEKNMQKSG